MTSAGEAHDKGCREVLRRQPPLLGDGETVGAGAGIKIPSRCGVLALRSCLPRFCAGSMARALTRTRTRPPKALTHAAPH